MPLSTVGYNVLPAFHILMLLPRRKPLGECCACRAGVQSHPIVFNHSEFEPTTVVRVRVRRSVVRVRISEAAIRIRVVARPQNHTARGVICLSRCKVTKFSPNSTRLREKRRGSNLPLVGSPSALFRDDELRYATMTNFPRKASRPPQFVLEPEEALFATA